MAPSLIPGGWGSPRPWECQGWALLALGDSAGTPPLKDPSQSKRGEGRGFSCQGSPAWGCGVWLRWDS